MASLPFLDQTIELPDGTSFERLDSITDFRQCHGVVPLESRILYRCKRLASSPLSTPRHDDDQEGYITKVKVQIPDANNNESTSRDTALECSNSNATEHELKALRIFCDAGSEYGPRIVAFASLRQGPDGLLPGGYISVTVMTKIPGKSLFDLGYWSLEPDDRAEIQQRFLEALAYVDHRPT